MTRNPSFEVLLTTYDNTEHT